MFRLLSVQMAALLTIALLPLGLIALYQTTRVAEEVERTAELALLGLTEQAARTEQLLIERAIGAARLFGTIAPDLLDDVDSCDANLSRFVDGNPRYRFIGVIPKSGSLSCSSSSGEQGQSSLPDFAEIMREEAATITLSRNNEGGLFPAFVVFEPYFVDREFSGFIAIAISNTDLPEITERLDDAGLEEIVTFNADGDILTYRSSRESALMEMPDFDRLQRLSVEGPQSFRATNAAGQERRYGVVTIDGSPAAILSVWRVTETATKFFPSIAPAMFPILMWFASLAVALMAVHTLILRHLRRMRRSMDAFADDRILQEQTDEAFLFPAEIEALETNFRRMSEEILSDEARMENAVREKDVLVKEIHHRVKNNLQLISSIINMQIRSSTHDETQFVLRSVQDRVLSLATIHRDLYQSKSDGRVNVGSLVTEIVEKSAEAMSLKGRTLNVQSEIDDILLYPDQAVPLSLLVSEAMTNVLKYAGSDIRVRLAQDGLDCTLEVENSIAETIEIEGTGLGSKLMKAFAMQLGGALTTSEDAGVFVLRMTFTANEFEHEVLDY